MCTRGRFFLESVVDPNVVLTLLPNNTLGAMFRKPVPVDGASPQLWTFSSNMHIRPASEPSNALQVDLNTGCVSAQPCGKTPNQVSFLTWIIIDVRS